MPTTIENARLNAQLAGRVYSRQQKNRTPVPTGWTELMHIPDTVTGFAALHWPHHMPRT